MVQEEPFTAQLRAKTLEVPHRCRMMSLVTSVPPAHINTPLTEADKIEAMDK